MTDKFRKKIYDAGASGLKNEAFVFI